LHWAIERPAGLDPTLDVVSPEDDSKFREQVASIEANVKTARGYLDRSTHHYGPHVGLPVAGLHNTDKRLSTAAAGEPACGARAVWDQYLGGGGYAGSYVLHGPVHCIRPAGHRGPHAGSVTPRSQRKPKWQAVTWLNHDDNVISLLLSPSYGAESPLWPSSEATREMIPAALWDDLLTWEREFESNFEWGSGWRTEKVKADWAAAATELIERVRQATESKSELVVNLWPLSQPEQRFPLQSGSEG
jgi:hypothetical protein